MARGHVETALGAETTNATNKDTSVSTAVCMSMFTRNQAVDIRASAKALWYLTETMT